jgi:tetratricopeptide (TPR) repeat protein
LWANRYEGEARDVLNLQDAVARDVVKQIRLHLTAEQTARLSRSRPVNPEAHEAYLRGLYCWNRRDRANLEKAVGYFNQAIAIDPNYALPYAGVGQSYIPLTYLGYVRGIDVRPRVEAALAKALELDDSLAEAHSALGSAKHFYEYDWAGAEREFRRAIELNPGYATAHQWYGQMLGCVGHGEEALVEHNRALELDPLSPIINSGTGYRLLRLQRYDEAAAALRSVVEIDPNFPSAHWNLGLTYTQQKSFAAAIQELQTADALFRGNALVQGGLGYAYGLSGDTAQAKAVLHRLEIQAKTQYVDPYALALVYVGLGSKDKAFEQLEKAIEDRAGWIGFIKGEPMLDGLHSDARFADLLRQMKLP